ncbi:hypothetical protein B0H12DRAFT_1246463, partial [Mycena haematopus]
MARSKKVVKPKEMFKPYNPDDVPAIMPFPALSHVATTKGEETAVPKLNDYQRSWILDVGVRDTDLPNLKGKAAIDFYDQVKHDAFDAKAFQHTLQPGDQVEEACLPALVAAWKQRKRDKKKGKSDEADDESSDEEEDEGARGALLRGYTKAGWRLAIQKVVSNKRAAERAKRKTVNNNTGEPTPKALDADKLAMEKLLGLTTYTGRDKFSDDRHDVIYEFSKTLEGSNAGGRFRHAESLLWAKEDQAQWEAAAAADEDVDWEERQKLVASGFKQMVKKLHATHKFRPFVATMLMTYLSDDGRLRFEAEAVPDDIQVRQPFKKQNMKLVDENVNAMLAWAGQPLKDYLAIRDRSSKGPAPVFPVTAEDISNIAPKALAETVTKFLTQSYEAAFGSGEIPWAAIVRKPSEYYNTENFPFSFTSNGLAELTLPQWYDLSSTLSAVAGVGTAGFFRKAPSAQPPSRSVSPTHPPPPPSRSASPTRPPPPPSRSVSPAGPPLSRAASPAAPPPSRAASPAAPPPSRAASPAGLPPSRPASP